MANALGTLFQDIADAIRTKTGDTATMKPAEFPDKILAIDTSSGGGSYDYDLAVGDSFEITYDGSSPTVECPNGITYEDDGGTLVFTADSACVGTIYIRDSDTLIAKYTVRVSESGAAASGTARVTFCNYDGTVLYSRLEFVGDDCPDPISQGKMDTPKRESTAQGTYTYNGWSLTEGGAANADALKNITEDRTVYAAYTQGTRYYTVRFYDGGTLMKTQSVAYGSQAVPPDTVKDGYTFVEWQPSDLTITGDTDFYGTWIEKISFSGSTWAKINEMCENGEAAENFAVGDEKIFPSAGGDISFKVRIVGMGLDTKSDGSGKAGITVILTKADGTPIMSSAWGSSQEKWGDSTPRVFCRNDIYEFLPSDLVDVIKPVSKKTMGKYEGSTYNTTLEETLFLPSTYEMGVTVNSFTDDGIKYPGLDTSAERKLGVAWWTRTTNSSSVYIVDGSGGLYSGYNGYAQYNSTNGIVPCFCI